jgi:HK97 family phage major capsid protein
MAYNNVISRTDVAGLIPEDTSMEIIQHVPESSAVLRLARKMQNIPRNKKTLPVTSLLPTAYFVNPSDTGKKQTTEVNWENKYITAEEIACIVPIPEAVLDDSDFDIWSEIKPHIQEAFGAAIDAAVLFGTSIPASWTTDLGAAGLLARATAASHTISLAGYTDLYEAILGEKGDGTDGVLMALEADGFMASGHIAHTSIKGKLRNCRDSDGQPIFKSGPNFGTQFATGELDGAPILYPLNGAFDVSQALLFSGAWNQLLYAMRQDITYKVLDQAVITDASNNIIYNLAQQDMVALRCVMRIGFALPNPVNRMNATAATRCPFAVLTA